MTEVGVQAVDRLDSNDFIIPEPPDLVNTSGFEQQQYEQSVATALRRKVDDFLGLKFFPTIKDYRDYVKFRRYQYARFDLYSAVITCILYAMVFVTRANLSNVPVYGSCFAAAFAVAVVEAVVFSVIAVSALLLYYGHSNINMTRDHEWLVEKCRDLLQSKLRWWIEEALPLFTSVSIGLYLIARVQAGQCAPSTTIWLSQSCNPVGDCGSIPHDTVILSYATPLIFQLALKGIRFHMIIISWCASTAFVLAAMLITQGYMQLWTVLYSLLFLYIICEIERIFRISYLQYIKFMKVQTIRRESAKSEATLFTQVEKLKRELKIVTSQAEKDKQSMEEERNRLRGMIGNVAHDLRTPLQSVGMSIELLRSDLTTTLRAKPAGTIEMQLAINEATLTSFSHTFDSLMSMSTFMKMSINRCMDFTKASSGLALTPMMESVEVIEALNVPIVCINSLQSEMKIIVDPIPDEICSFVITDKQWLMENILCMLSNAVKYSTGGIVNLFMITEFRTHEFISHKVLKITVEDTGIGIPDEAKAKLFQPFRQGQRMAGGTGLGLYSLSKRMEALGGSYGVHDRKDGRQGTAFWISFPYRPDPMSVPTAPTATEGMTTGKHASSLRNLIPKSPSTLVSPKSSMKTPPLDVIASERPSVDRGQQSRRRSETAVVIHAASAIVQNKISLNILIIEDSLSILKVVAQMLRSKGHHVDTAINGGLGLDRLMLAHAKNELDVCLCDLQMPVMDGIECTRRYREYEKLQRHRKSNPQEDHPKEEFLLRNGNPMSSALEGQNEADAEKGYSLRKVGEVDVNRLPIIGMSANNDTLSKDAAIEAGMNLFIAKPFTIKDLENVLEQFKPRNRK